jgi:hypothetical protein
MTDQEKLEQIIRLKGDLRTYAALCLKVKPKVGPLQPFLFNQAQLHIHQKLEEQREKLGWVRAIICKGRQQGCSTYIGARFYQRTSMTPAQSAFIITHEDKATANLFSMVKRYHDHNPLAPSTKASNAQELVFGKLDGGYKLATAGSKDVGRSNTAQLLHGSEVGFWANAESHMAGIGNTLLLAPGTEIILESTGNGLGNYYHETWQAAEIGESDYIPIFVPWMWQPEYARAVPPGFALTEEEAKYQATYGCTLEQMVWRRGKIQEYGRGFAWLFDQEYPATPLLAFQSPSADPIISPSMATLAASSGLTMADAIGPLVIGCDPAEEGEDRTAIAFRRGRVCYRLEYHRKMRPMQVAGLLAQYYRDHSPAAIFVDKIGIGSGIVDRMRELGIPVIGVTSGEAATEPDVYANKKAEMWWRMQAWFEDQPARIPKNGAFQADLCAPNIDRDSKGRKQVEPKPKMKKRGIRSPDGADALAMTFAEHVADLSSVVARQGSGRATTAGY